MIPPDPELVDDPDEVLDRIDGLILAGGADIDRASYGAERPPGDARAPSPERDRGRARAARAARSQRDMPVLGICRGMQLMNVALGGTLRQHVPDAGRPRGAPAPSRQLRRTPTTTCGWRRARWPHAPPARSSTARSPTTTRASTVIGDGLVVTGLSTLDELPEAIEAPASRFVLGVQWHPEADEHSRVIGALVEQARDYRSAPRLRRSRPRRVAGVAIDLVTSSRGRGRASRAPAGPPSRGRAGRYPRGCAGRRAGSRRCSPTSDEQLRQRTRAVGQPREQHEPPSGLALVAPGDVRRAGRHRHCRRTGSTTVVPLGRATAAGRRAAPRRRPRPRPRPRAWPARAGTPSPRRHRPRAPPRSRRPTADQRQRQLARPLDGDPVGDRQRRLDGDRMRRPRARPGTERTSRPARRSPRPPAAATSARSRHR